MEKWVHPIINKEVLSLLVKLNYSIKTPVLKLALRLSIKISFVELFRLDHYLILLKAL